MPLALSVLPVAAEQRSGQYWANLGLAVLGIAQERTSKTNKQKKLYSFKAEDGHFVELFGRSTW